MVTVLSVSVAWSVRLPDPDGTPEGLTENSAKEFTPGVGAEIREQDQEVFPGLPAMASVGAAVLKSPSMRTTNAEPP